MPFSENGLFGASDSQYMKLEKVEEHIPEWFNDWKQEKQNFKIYAEKEPDLPDKKKAEQKQGIHLR